MGFIYSPYVTLFFSLMVLFKWCLKLVYSFQWVHLGAVFARFMFTIIFGIVLLYVPREDTWDFLAQMAINVLFIDELITWGVSKTKGQGVNLVSLVKEFFYKKGGIGT